MKQIVICIFIGLIFNSCMVYNAAHKEDREVCALHGKNLKRTLAGVQYGYLCREGNLPEYPNAKHRECMGCVVRSYRYAVIWSCRTCTKIKRKAKRQ